MLSEAALTCQAFSGVCPLPSPRLDPAFKLFGRTIPVSSSSSAAEHPSASVTIKSIEAIIDVRKPAAIKKDGDVQDNNGAAEFDDLGSSDVPDDLGSSVHRSDGFNEKNSNEEADYLIAGDSGPVADERSALVGRVSGVSDPALVDRESGKTEDSTGLVVDDANLGNGDSSMDNVATAKKPDNHNNCRPISDISAPDLVGVEINRAEESRLMLHDGVGHAGSPYSMENETPKRPNKPIPCPRCDSHDTKFCYFNNYNVSQPRHFCKNCHRYWTAGGTLRNVPVGAGRRKNKHLSSAAHQRSLLADGLTVRLDSSECAQQLLSPPNSLTGFNKHMKAPFEGHQSLPLSSIGCLDSPPSSAVISFGKESLLLGDQSFNSNRGGLLQDSLLAGDQSSNSHKGERSKGYKSELIMVGQENLHRHQNREADVPNVKDLDMIKTTAGNRHESASADCAGLSLSNSAPGRSNGECMPLPTQSHALDTVEAESAPPAPCTLPNHSDAAAALGWMASGAPFSFMGGPWPYAGNAGWGDASSNLPLQSALPGAVVGTSATGGHSLQPMPLGLESLWASRPLGGLWAAGIPWPLMQNPLSWMSPVCWGGMPAWAPGGPVLGKHPREEAYCDGVEGVLAPKTLRIGNPADAGRSSIWAALGIDNLPGSLASGGILSAVPAPKPERKGADACHDHHTRSTNPAALSRSMAFQESNLGLQSVEATDNES